MTEFFLFIEKCFKPLFHIMPKIGHKYNYLMIVAGFAGLALWLYMQKKYNDEADKNGTLK